MAIKHGQILHDGAGFVIDRIQTGGVSNLNIPVERINELGNFETVATVRDIPDLSFEIESLDVSTEIEALLTRYDPTTTVAGQEFDFREAIPLDIVSPFKTGQNLYTIFSGVALPYLTLENATYRFGVAANATQTFTLRGDSIYYVPGTPYYQQWTKAGGTTYSFAHTALPYVSGPDTFYALDVCYYDPATRLYSRLVFGDDYTNDSSGFTIDSTTHAAIPADSIIHTVYGSATAATYNQTVHEDTSVKPAAVRGKNIDIYIASGATPVMTRWTSVQSFEVSWRVTLDADREFGNEHYVSQDYDTPAVTGNIVVRPRDVNDLFTKIQEVTNTSTSEIAGAFTSQSVAMEARIYDPDSESADPIKTLYVPDARFTPPSIQGRVGQKLEPTFNFESDGGVLIVYEGARP
jgi:hypothetical protein